MCRFDPVVVAEENRVIFQIPVRNFDRFERDIAKLSVRSEKLGGGSISTVLMGCVDKDGKDHYEVYLSAPELRIGDYVFVARLDHSQETGNIIRMMPNTGYADLPEIYRTVGPKCDHCNVNRMRRDTFVLRNQKTGGYVQLGSTCLAEYFMSDPRDVARRAEIFSYAHELAEAAKSKNYGLSRPVRMQDLRYIPMEDYLLHCAATMRVNNGRYYKAAYRDASTRDCALNSLYGRFGQEITDADHSAFAKAMEWIDSLATKAEQGKTLNQYEHNILVIGRASVIEYRATGLAASIMGYYRIALEREAAKNAPKKVAAPKALKLDDMSALNEFFIKAGTRLRFPKITISFPNTGEVVLSVATSRAQYPDSISVCSTGGYGNNTFYGRIHTDGRWQQYKAVEGLQEALVAFATDPAGVAAEYGKRSGSCCFCHKPLTDQTSAAVGYGATCAKNWGLPYGKKAATEALA